MFKLFSFDLSLLPFCRSTSEKYSSGKNHLKKSQNVLKLLLWTMFWPHFFLRYTKVCTGLWKQTVKSEMRLSAFQFYGLVFSQFRRSGQLGTVGLPTRNGRWPMKIRSLKTPPRRKGHRQRLCLVPLTFVFGSMLRQQVSRSLGASGPGLEQDQDTQVVPNCSGETVSCRSDWSSTSTTTADMRFGQSPASGEPNNRGRVWYKDNLKYKAWVSYVRVYICACVCPRPISKWCGQFWAWAADS